MIRDALDRERAKMDETIRQQLQEVEAERQRSRATAAQAADSTRRAMDLDTQATDKLRRAAQIETEARDAVKKARNECQLTLGLVHADKDETQHQLEELRKHAAAAERALNDAVL